MTSTETTKETAKKAIRKSSPWLVRLGRLGYAVKGVVYVVMGLLATQAAIQEERGGTDTRDALITIGQAPFGKISLLIVAIGLFGYAAWRLVSAAMDAERRGDSPTGASIRIGAAFRGLVYGSLGVWTLRYLTSHAGANTNQSRSLTRRVLELPGGRWIVIAVGLSFIGYAVYQVYRAFSGKFLKRLALNGSPKTETWVRYVGTFGITARAVVFGMIGVLFIDSGWQFDPSNVGGIRQSLNAISRQPFGEYAFALVAFGLIAFGIFELATARFRIMRAM